MNVFQEKKPPAKYKGQAKAPAAPYVPDPGKHIQPSSGHPMDSCKQKCSDFSGILDLVNPKRTAHDSSLR